MTRSTDPAAEAARTPRRSPGSQSNRSGPYQRSSPTKGATNRLTSSTKNRIATITASATTRDPVTSSPPASISHPPGVRRNARRRRPPGGGGGGGDDAGGGH